MVNAVSKMGEWYSNMCVCVSPHGGTKMPMDTLKCPWFGSSSSPTNGDGPRSTASKRHRQFRVMGFYTPKW